MQADLQATLISLAIGILSALSAYIISLINSKKVSKKIESIEKAIDNSETKLYVICPNCNEKIYLKDITIKDEKE